jgi:hypothetical protein
MTEERIPTLMPGDPITYLVRFGCPSLIESITAVFVNEDTGSEIHMIGWQADNRQERMRGGRIQTVALNLADDSPPPEPGRYRLANLTAHTYGGKPLDFNNPPEDAFRYGEEPDDLPIVVDHMFMLPKGHPNLDPSRDKD